MIQKIGQPELVAAFQHVRPAFSFGLLTGAAAPVLFSAVFTPLPLGNGGEEIVKF
ncbi:MAG TPA: hypothetical protein H9694_07560 [Firmicutes bacterium]|nr:hypothetical protein [Bacillota bacterium]